MITVLVRRVAPIAGLGVLFVLAARSADLRLLGDMWFHLRMGEEFLAGWPISDPGHLGAYDSADWVPTQWLSQIGMAAVENAAGLGGVLWVAAAVQILLIACLYFTSRGTTAPLPAALATALALSSIAAGLSPRPQIVSYCLIALIVWAWLATARDGRPRYVVIALSWLWVPLHGMWPLGLVVSVVLALGVVLDRRPARADTIKILSIPALSALVSLATPLGWKAVEGVVSVGDRKQYFTEWAPPSFPDLDTIGVSIMFALVLIRLLRSASVSWTSVLLLGVALGCAIMSVRTVPIAAILIAPLFAQAVQEFVPVLGPARRKEVLVVAAMATTVLAALALSLAQRADEQVAPRWLDTYLDAAPAGTKVLNDWDTGSYFLWRHPQVDLAMHGYVDVFTDAELQRNSALLDVRPGWDDGVAVMGADIAVLQTRSSLAYALVEHAGWTTIDGDEDFVLLAPPAG